MKVESKECVFGAFHSKIVVHCLCVAREHVVVQGSNFPAVPVPECPKAVQKKKKGRPV